MNVFPVHCPSSDIARVIGTELLKTSFDVTYMGRQEAASHIKSLSTSFPGCEEKWTALQGGLNALASRLWSHNQARCVVDMLLRGSPEVKDGFDAAWQSKVPEELCNALNSLAPEMASNGVRIQGRVVRGSGHIEVHVVVRLIYKMSVDGDWAKLVVVDILSGEEMSRKEAMKVCGSPILREMGKDLSRNGSSNDYSASRRSSFDSVDDQKLKALDLWTKNSSTNNPATRIRPFSSFFKSTVPGSRVKEKSSFFGTVGRALSTVTTGCFTTPSARPSSRSSLAPVAEKSFANHAK